MKDQLTKQQLNDIIDGDYPDNSVVDSACAKRLLKLCRDFGKDGQEAEKLLKIVCNKIEVYI